MTDPEIWADPQIGDVVVFTGDLLPELEGPTVFVLVEIDPGKRDPYRFWQVIDDSQFISAPRDWLSGIPGIRGASRGFYQ